MKTFKKLLYLIMIVLAVNIVAPANTAMFTGNIQANAAVSISKKSATLIKGQTLTLKIKGTKKKVKWLSSNSGVAKVTSKGKVTAKGKGVATITAEVNGTKYSCKITVETPSISKTKQTAYVGQTVELKVNGTTQKISWKTSNKKIATVNSSGVVTLKKKGTATITATVAKKQYKCKITVKNAIRVTSFGLWASDMWIKEEEFQNLSYYIYPNNATNKKVTWTSSNNSVAKVDSDGNVFGISPGTATITAVCDGKKSNCLVNVARNFNEVTAAKSMSWTSYKTSRGIVAIVKNNYEYPANIEADFLFYDANGKLIGKDTKYSSGLEVGRETALFGDVPRDANFNMVKYSSYKIAIRASEADIIGNASKISCSANFGADNVMVTVKNNGVANDNTEIAIVFYKNGYPVGYDWLYADVNYAGQTDTLKFDFPYDEQYETIYPNSYKIFVNNSYKYDWS